MSKTLQIGSYELRYGNTEHDGEFPSEIFSDFKGEPFLHVNNFLSQQEIDILYEAGLASYGQRRMATVHDYSSGNETYKLDTSGRTTHILPCPKIIYDILENKLVHAIYPLLEQNYVVGGEFIRREGWQVLGYGEGFFFGNHCDNCIHGSQAPEGPGRSQTWWCNEPNRKFTVLLYLNDQREDYVAPGTYAGGDLVLTKLFKDDKQAVIKPKAGDLLAFPSHFMFTHAVQKVIKGYRMSCVTWVDVKNHKNIASMIDNGIN